MRLVKITLKEELVLKHTIFINSKKRCRLNVIRVILNLKIKIPYCTSVFERVRIFCTKTCLDRKMDILKMVRDYYIDEIRDLEAAAQNH